MNPANTLRYVVPVVLIFTLPLPASAEAPGVRPAIEPIRGQPEARSLLEQDPLIETDGLSLQEEPIAERTEPAELFAPANKTAESEQASIVALEVSPEVAAIIEPTPCGDLTWMGPSYVAALFEGPMKLVQTGTGRYSGRGDLKLETDMDVLLACKIAGTGALPGTFACYLTANDLRAPGGTSSLTVEYASPGGPLRRVSNGPIAVVTIWITPQISLGVQSDNLKDSGDPE